MNEKRYEEINFYIDNIYLDAGRIIFKNISNNGVLNLNDKSITQAYHTIKGNQITSLKNIIVKENLDNTQKSFLLDKLNNCNEYLFHSMTEGNKTLLNKLANNYILQQIAANFVNISVLKDPALRRDFSPEQAHNKLESIKTFIKIFENIDLVSTPLYLNNKTGLLNPIEKNKDIQKAFSEILVKNKMLDKEGFIKNYNSYSSDKLEFLNKSITKSISKIKNNIESDRTKIQKVLEVQNQAKTKNKIVLLDSINLDAGDDAPKFHNSLKTTVKKIRDSFREQDLLSKAKDSGDELEKNGFKQDPKKSSANQLPSNTNKIKSKGKIH